MDTWCHNRLQVAQRTWRRRCLHQIITCYNYNSRTQFDTVIKSYVERLAIGQALIFHVLTKC